jgi:hypothetical protein
MNSTYLLKLWLSTIAATPVLLILVTFISSDDLDFDSGIITFYFVLVLYGLLFSIPAVLVVSLLSFFLRKSLKDSALRTFYIFTSLISMTLTFWLVYSTASNDNSEYYRGFTLTAVYGISIVFFGIIYRLN